MKPLKYLKILKDPFCIENKLCLLQYDFMVFEIYLLFVEIWISVFKK